ncbi:Outer membrane porin protein 32 [Paraburkholderia nemoris]|uniref:porin n=1 Tax=Paraburkholderia nemoris TaxID=2793076 RepID=UPI00190D0B84|nr:MULTISPECIES: porin [Paraburkholderia]MBK3786558.1 porin [Paraburkholderia aspalathi]CAE6857709.1 Outer membrane porin protein 32 [Paraburkholderia nemoris]
MQTRRFCVFSAALLFCGAVQAQTVQLFGIVDVNVRSVHNGNAGTAIGMGDGTLNASRIGFRGLEDLGGGLKAGFWLENGFKPENGAQSSSTSFFNRRSTVSLISDRYGELRLGHDNAPAYFNLITFDPFGGGGVASFINLFTAGAFSTPLMSGAATISRTDNSVGYFLPDNLGGVYGQAQYSFNNDAAYGNKQLGARLGYASGPLNVAAVVNSTQLAHNYDFNLYDIGFAYAISRARLMAQYSYMTTTLTGNYAQRSGQLTFLVGATIPIDLYQINVAYSNARGTGALDGLKADQYALGGIYNLSKRTALYTAVSAIKNRGKSGYITGPLPAVTASTMSSSGVFQASNMTGKSSVGMELGLRHLF